MNSPLAFIMPDWSAPSNVCSVVTVRRGGKSLGPFAGFNLATHVGDDAQNVVANRKLLINELQLQQEPVWLDQMHGNRVVEAGSQLLPKADGIFTTQSKHPVAILVADCVPILLCDKEGTRIGAVHAGWKGLAGGVINSLVKKLGYSRELIAWLGPAIGPCHYEVGSDVIDAFGFDSGLAVKKVKKSKWKMDMWEIARHQLKQVHVNEIYGGGVCTYCRGEDFFSYRRDGVTGRNAVIIWLN
ncbi:MAG: peptidoglycan editing factor PgeF [Gammaproteobacteria bacterium]|nr:peptidoglycan editing factor PgeF [Gammaproteobacteria bacterium]